MANETKKRKRRLKKTAKMWITRILLIVIIFALLASLIAQVVYFVNL